MPRSTRTFSSHTTDAAELLGLHVAQARRERRWTIEEVAERAGVTVYTVRKVERGDPTVALGTAFEVAWLVGVPLFGAEASGQLAGRVRDARDRLALLPRRVRRSGSVVPSDDF